MAPQKSFFGFTEPTNNSLYKWLAIPFTIFVLLRMSAFPIDNLYCAPTELFPGTHAGPGECYYPLTFPRKYWGLTLHLASVLPGGILAVAQFTPRIRSKYRRFHRSAGYIATGLGFTGIITAWAITDTAFGGSASTISASLTAGAFSAYALYKGVAEARAKRYASHRDWMLRAWVAMGSVLTLRLLMPPLLALITLVPAFQQYNVVPCEVVLHVIKNDTAAYAAYPVCAPDSLGGGYALNGPGYAVVKADLTSGSELELGAAFRSIFGAAFWGALLLHAVGVEVYLRWDQNRVAKGRVAVATKGLEGKAE